MDRCPTCGSPPHYHLQHPNLVSCSLCGDWVKALTPKGREFLAEKAKADAEMKRELRFDSVWIAVVVLLVAALTIWAYSN